MEPESQEEELDCQGKSLITSEGRQRTRRPNTDRQVCRSGCEKKVSAASNFKIKFDVKSTDESGSPESFEIEWKLTGKMKRHSAVRHC